MSFKQKPKRRGWLIGLAVVAVVAIAGYFAATRLGLLGQGGEAGAPDPRAT